MAETTEERPLDKRTIERLIQNGQIEDAVYKRQLKALPDVADQAQPIETIMDDDAEYDEDDEETEPGNRK